MTTESWPQLFLGEKNVTTGCFVAVSRKRLSLNNRLPFKAAKTHYVRTTNFHRYNT